MRKMDESEQFIATKTIKVAFIYSLIFEITYWILECIEAKSFVTSKSSMFFLIVTQGIVLVSTGAVLKSKIFEEKNLRVMVISLVCAMLLLVVGLIILKIGI